MDLIKTLSFSPRAKKSHCVCIFYRVTEGGNSVLFKLCFCLVILLVVDMKTWFLLPWLFTDNSVVYGRAGRDIMSGTVAVAPFICRRNVSWSHAFFQFFVVAHHQSLTIRSYISCLCIIPLVFFIVALCVNVSCWKSQSALITKQPGECVIRKLSEEPQENKQEGFPGGSVLGRSPSWMEGTCVWQHFSGNRKQEGRCAALGRRSQSAASQSNCHR